MTAGAPKEMSLFLRGGQVLTVRVSTVRVGRSPLNGESETRIENVRLDAIDAITLRDVPEQDESKETPAR